MSTLPVGSYEVAVEALEFTRFVCKGITIRIAQVQRSILQDLTVEAAYVGNRGVWLQSDNMLHLNAVTLYRIHAAGFDRTNAADRAVLTSPWNSPAAQSRGIRAPYPSFPAGQQAIQTLRPYPQFNTITPRWTSFGNSWYDSLHVKVTKRYSHGLDLSGSFSWHKSMFIGDTRGGAVNDVYNRQQNKYLSSQDIPVMMTIAFTYVTPAATGNPIVRAVTRDWNLGGLLRYQSGLPIESPRARNNLDVSLFRTTYANRVPGEPLFLKDLNGGDVDPNKDFVLNPAAWSDPAPGQWGTAAAFYGDYRQQRRPVEQLGLGRTFRIKERMTFEVRSEFFNVFNRTQMANPTSNNALQTPTRNAAGVPTAGFGRINSAELAQNPREGHLVLRLQF